jgi:hypothetical protein
MGSLSTEAVLFIFILPLYPLTRFVLPRLKSRRMMLYFNLASGLGLNLLLFRSRALFAIMTSVIGYFALEWTPLYTMTLMFGLNAYTHLWHFLNVERVWSMEVTGSCMMMLQRVISLCYNIHDGRVLKSQGKCPHDRFATFSVANKPSPLEFFAYCFSPFGAITGPFIEFRCFDYLCDLPSRVPIAPDSPDRRRANLYFAGSIAHAAGAIAFGKYFTYESSYGSSFYLASPWFVRLFLMTGISLFHAAKYYVMWYAVQAALLECGLNASGFSREEDFSNVTVLYFLESKTINDWGQRWNHSAHVFLRNYLYVRFLDVGGNRNVGKMLVFVCSAFWHGFKPPYYLVLIEMFYFGFGDTILLKRWPIAKDEPLWKEMIRHVYVAVCMFSSASAWWFGTWEAFRDIHASHYWAPMFIMTAGYAFAWATMPKRPPKTE